ncbi:MAG: hypothetical protein Q8O89_07295 [Nanoarchaeota archaeon]|nr:hypothetical protein [Nanoarchaeota archaeon]
MKNYEIKDYKTAFLSALLGAVFYVCTSCGGGGGGGGSGAVQGSPNPPSQNVQVASFEERTRKKFEPQYKCNFSNNKTLYVADLDSNVEGVTTADKYASCSASGKDSLDIYLLDRHVDGANSFEQQLAQSAPPHVICVGKNQDLGKVVDEYYSKMN